MYEGLQVKKITAQYFLLISSAKKIIKKNYFMLIRWTLDNLVNGIMMFKTKQIK